MTKAKVAVVPADCMPMCKTCVFFVIEPQNEVGECRRYPPVNIPIESSLTYEFAITEPGFWCGEYRRLTN